MSGVEVVTIPLEHYSELLRAWNIVDKAEADAERLRPLPRSPIERNPEVAAFLTERFGKMELEDVVTAAKTAFGEDHAPSRSAVQRYWKKLRRKAALKPL